MHRVDPAAGQIGQNGAVLEAGQHSRLGPVADELAHDRIAAKRPIPHHPSRLRPNPCSIMTNPLQESAIMLLCMVN
jgi:hypothetical protein